jgi:ABC-type glutathione transport system ATPase component
VGTVSTSAGAGGGPVLSVEGLTVSYSSTRFGRAGKKDPESAAVKDVDLVVESGEIVGLVGESGSGKSSIALAVLGLVPVAAGTIVVGGQNLMSLRGRALRAARADAQMVFQDPFSSLDPRQRIGKGFSEIRRYHGKRTGWATNDGLLALVGLDPTTLDRYPHQLSGGQIQRVVIARALLMRPNLLIADEPTSSLDVSIQAQVLEIFTRLRDTVGLSILFISHDLSVVRHLASRVYVMRGGLLVEHGETEELMTAPQHPYTQKLLAAIPGQSAASVISPAGSFPT